MSHTPEEIQNQYDKLPDHLKELVVSIETYEILKEIRQKFSLDDNQASELGSITGLVLMGLEPTTEIINQLKSRLGTDDTKSASIAKELNDRIFSQMKNVSVNKDGAETKTNISALKQRGIKTFTLPTDPIGERLEKPTSMPPSNLPTNQDQPSQRQYPGGTDPYREPIV